MNRFKFDPANIKKVNKNYNIVVCADKKIFNQIFVLIMSAKENLKKYINFYILSSELSPDYIKEFHEFGASYNISIMPINLDKELFYGFNLTRLPIETYFYLYIHKIIPETEDRALIIDVDTLFLKDIPEFYDNDFEDQYVIAANEYQHISYKKYKEILEGKIKNKEGHVYNEEMSFNSGVMLLNLKKLRNEKITLDSFRKLVRPQDMGGFFHDQLVFNRFVGGKSKFVPRLYFNSAPIFINENIEIFKAKDKNFHEVILENNLDDKYVNSIIHYCGVGGLKPWNANVTFKNNTIKVLNDKIPEQNLYLQKWWEYALKLPAKIFLRLWPTSEHLASELDYFKGYTQIFRDIFTLPEDIETLIKYLKAKGVKQIAFYGANQIAYALAPLLPRHGVEVRYVVENMAKSNIFSSIYPKEAMDLPQVDLMLVMDVKNGDRIAQKIREKFKFKIMTIYELIAVFK